MNKKVPNKSQTFCKYWPGVGFGKSFYKTCNKNEIQKWKDQSSIQNRMFIQVRAAASYFPMRQKPT